MVYLLLPQLLPLLLPVLLHRLPLVLSTVDLHCETHIHAPQLESSQHTKFSQFTNFRPNVAQQTPAVIAVVVSHSLNSLPIKAGRVEGWRGGGGIQVPQYLQRQPENFHSASVLLQYQWHWNLLHV